MFDKNKIIFNNRRSFKASNKKVNLFLSKLSEDAIQRLEIDKRKKNNVLEILAKSNIFVKTLEKKNIKTETFQTFFPNTINFNQKNMIINNNKLSAIDDEKIDCCISFFPAFAKSDLTFILKSIYRILKFEGKFLFLFFSSDSCSKLKKIFYDIFKTKVDDMFMPSPDILLLGNIANLMGYKNVVVDKPIQVIYASSKGQQDLFLQTRALIVVEENAQVQITERHQNLDDSFVFTNAVTEIVADANAIVDFYKIQNKRGIN